MPVVVDRRARSGDGPSDTSQPPPVGPHGIRLRQKGVPFAGGVLDTATAEEAELSLLRHGAAAAASSGGVGGVGTNGGSTAVGSGAAKALLPRGDMLLIGGDLAYPNPTR